MRLIATIFTYAFHTGSIMSCGGSHVIDRRHRVPVTITSPAKNGYRRDGKVDSLHGSPRKSFSLIADTEKD